ncbi:6982_t:CDS:2 [Diversispora eburnea]|uniref:6982_t:CDS:1 n=1 Tax=Diversispora eburnea TaxID=1213867 RepID=A0A9N9FTI5_9GLOM|nr:6982_t:CDS:2 [Diversispora eburnea]
MVDNEKILNKFVLSNNGNELNIITGIPYKISNSGLYIDDSGGSDLRLSRDNHLPGHPFHSRQLWFFKETSHPREYKILSGRTNDCLDCRGGKHKAKLYLTSHDNLREESQIWSFYTTTNSKSKVFQICNKQNNCFLDNWGANGYIYFNWYRNPPTDKNYSRQLWKFIPAFDYELNALISNFEYKFPSNVKKQPIKKTIREDILDNQDSSVELITTFNFQEELNNTYSFSFNESLKFISETKLNTILPFMDIEKEFNFKNSFEADKRITTEKKESCTITKKVKVPPKSCIKSIDYVDFVENIEIPFEAAAEIIAASSDQFKKDGTLVKNAQVDEDAVKLFLKEKNFQGKIIGSKVNSILAKVNGTFRGSYFLRTYRKLEDMVKKDHTVDYTIEGFKLKSILRDDFAETKKKLKIGLKILRQSAENMIDNIDNEKVQKIPNKFVLSFDGKELDIITGVPYKISNFGNCIDDWGGSDGSSPRLSHHNHPPGHTFYLRQLWILEKTSHPRGYKILSGRTVDCFDSLGCGHQEKLHLSSTNSNSPDENSYNINQIWSFYSTADSKSKEFQIHNEQNSCFLDSHGLFSRIRFSSCCNSSMGEKNLNQLWKFIPAFDYKLNVVINNFKYKLSSDIKKHRLKKTIREDILDNVSSSEAITTINFQEELTNTYSFSFNESLDFISETKLIADIPFMDIEKEFNFKYNFEANKRITIVNEESCTITKEVKVQPKSCIKAIDYVDFVENIEIPFEATAKITALSDQFKKDGTIIKNAEVDEDAVKLFLKENNFQGEIIRSEGNSVIAKVNGVFCGSYFLKPYRKFEDTVPENITSNGI